MADIINLRQARKAKAKSAAEDVAAQNRVSHGRTKAERQASKARGALETHRLDGHLLGREPAADDRRDT